MTGIPSSIWCLVCIIRVLNLKKYVMYITMLKHLKMHALRWHTLLKADLGSKEEDIIFLPFNLKRSVGKLRKNQRGKDEEDQPGIIRKRISTLKCNNYK